MFGLNRCNFWCCHRSSTANRVGGGGYSGGGCGGYSGGGYSGGGNSGGGNDADDVYIVARAQASFFLAALTALADVGHVEEGEAAEESAATSDPYPRGNGWVLNYSDLVDPTRTDAVLLRIATVLGLPNGRSSPTAPAPAQALLRCLRAIQDRAVWRYVAAPALCCHG
jgi:hypothetical protein